MNVRRKGLPRDANGWRIPRPGTLRRQIYELLVDGHKPSVIAREVGRSRVYVSVTAWTIRNPDARNAHMGAKDYAEFLEVKGGR